MNDIRAPNAGILDAVPPVRYQIPESPVTIAIIHEGGIPSRYQIIEPELTDNLVEILNSLRNHLSTILRDKIQYKKFSSAFTREFTHTAKEAFPSLDDEEIRKLEYYIRRDTRGFGQVQPLIDDPSVSIIFVKGPERNITITHTQYGSLNTSLFLPGDEIITLLRKICNRSAVPVDITDLPSEITLRAGHSVRLSLPSDGTIPLIFTIKKTHPAGKKSQDYRRKNQTGKDSFYIPALSRQG